MEEASIITDLSIVVVSAAVISVLFKILRLPVMLGYILGGLIVGPNLLPEPLVKNFHAIDELKELGVAFLMFYIGLEFDLRKVQKILAPADVGGGVADCVDGDGGDADGTIVGMVEYKRVVFRVFAGD